MFSIRASCKRRNNYRHCYQKLINFDISPSALSRIVSSRLYFCVHQFLLLTLDDTIIRAATHVRCVSLVRQASDNSTASELYCATMLLMQLAIEEGERERQKKNLSEMSSDGWKDNTRAPREGRASLAAERERRMRRRRRRRL